MLEHKFVICYVNVVVKIKLFAVYFNSVSEYQIPSGLDRVCLAFDLLKVLDILLSINQFF